ncbi:MAG TPA: hypothetical protein DDW76_06470 [Cyanobacteria bacterium UBA11369]|nr:hypothetical protein [Cyanobacteria bacterium UBA11371]HBE36495.1 hypothetical protein [Cyanobacteria bacterium UBA11368]HBE48446.1 hypothetical protein [Cyanobacteria bacterium UBA11369]
MPATDNSNKPAPARVLPITNASNSKGGFNFHISWLHLIGRYYPPLHKPAPAKYHNEAKGDNKKDGQRYV